MDRNLLALMPKLSPTQVGWLADIVVGNGIMNTGDRAVVPFLSINRVMQCITVHRNRSRVGTSWYGEFLELCAKLEAYHKEGDNG